MKDWLSIREAAVVTGRHQSRIYRWVDAGNVRHRTGPHGTLQVDSIDLLRAEAAAKPGRPARA